MIKPRSIVQNHESLQFINPNIFFEEITKIPLERRLIGALALAGCESWDDEGRYVKDSSVSVLSINGTPLGEDTTPRIGMGEVVDRIVDQSHTSMELSAAFSYLNSGNLEPGQLYDRVVGLGHLSVAHTVSVSLLVAGATVAVENEFNSQRDLAHLSRITVGRTSLQSYPPVVVSDPRFVDATRSIVEYTDATLANIQTPRFEHRDDRMDFFESRNIVYPASKATAFILTATLRNAKKMTDQRTDKGKEAEYRSILDKIKVQLGAVYPEIFNQ